MKTVTRWFSLVIIQVLLTGCTQYIYQGQIKATDSLGEEKTHLIYWNKTQRKLWFDSSAGSITLLSECSTNTVQYDDRASGITFRKRDSDKIVSSNPGNNCGKVIGQTQIKDIKEGQIKLTVHCEPEIDDFTVGGIDRYLKARAEPYSFPITKSVTKDLMTAIPKRPNCEK